MNKKLIISLSLIVLLSGCVSNKATSLAFVPYDYSCIELNNKIDINEDNYYQLKEYSPLEYEEYDESRGYINDFRDLYSSTNNGRTYLNAPSTGEQHLLVIPVSFTDSDKTNQDEKKILINNAFFGDESKNNFYSVGQYFDIASYGHLKLKGTVSDFYNIDLSSTELRNNINSRTSSSRYAASRAVEWYQENHDDISLYDNDKDGYIDSVFIVYDHPFDNSTDSLYWAYVDHMNKNEGINFLDGQGKIYVNNIEGNKYVSTYAWASYNFLYPNNNYVDTHVYVHESGHLFGLVDYYSNNSYQPLGYLDMMDYNLGDHNAYSKMLLNWSTPKVVSGSGNISIRPSILSGDVILIPTNSYNNTPYDEYLLLEYFAPISINEKDDRLSFTYNDAYHNSRTGKLYNQYGLKVYHVDSRLAYFKNKGLSSIIAMLDDEDYQNKLDNYRKTSLNRYCLDFAFDNNNSSHPLIALLPADDENALLDGSCASNASLFKRGDSFGINNYQNFKFYNGDELEYSFVIEDINPDRITINFSHK